MKRILFLVPMLCFSCMAAGCKIKLVNDGEVGFAQTTRWGFYHTAKATTGEQNPSSIETHSQPLEEWWAGKNANPAPQTPVAPQPLPPTSSARNPG